VPQHWPQQPGDRPPVVPSSAVPWPPGRAALLDRPQGGPDGPPVPPGPPSPLPRAWMTAVIVLAVLLVLAVGALVWPGGDEAGSPSSTTASTRPRTSTSRAVPGAPSTPPNSQSPSSPPGVTPPSTAAPSGPAPSAAEVQAALDPLIAFVTGHRGLPFSARPAVSVVDSATFDGQAEAEVDRHATALQRRALLLQVLGVVDPQVDVVAAMRSLEPFGEVARYDQVTRTVVVRAQPISPYTREQLVAALTAALDDQHFGTDRPTYDDAPDELRWSFDGLRLGDATRLGDLYAASLAPADKAARDQAEAAATAGFDPSRLAPAIVELLAFPGESGSAFAAELAKATSAPLDAAFVTPPHPTADVLHPERFVGQVPVVEVPPPAADGRELSRGTFGELLTVATLADTLGPARAASAAAGWAGDAFVLYEGTGGAPCVRIAYRASSPAAFDRLQQGYTEWAAEHEGTDVKADRGSLTISRCVTGGAGRSPA
jgi:hypothetical protein